jgi:hypothetical protein
VKTLRECFECDEAGFNSDEISFSYSEASVMSVCVGITISVSFAILDFQIEHS